MNRVLLFFFFIFALVVDNVHADELIFRDNKAQLSQDSKISFKIKNLVIKKKPIIKWTGLPSRPKTNPFKLEFHTLHDLERYRENNELFRENLEDNRKQLEKLRINKNITKEQYFQQIDNYKMHIRDYRKGVNSYKEALRDLNRRE
jgi:hypothetical protein